MNATFATSGQSEYADIDRICYSCVGDLPCAGAICPHCGWDNSQRSDNFGHLPACTIGNGRYFVGRALGNGGFGITYIGRDLLAGYLEDSRRAIKEFFPAGKAIRDIDRKTVLPSSPDAIEFFVNRKKKSINEGDQIKRVSNQISNVVRAFDFFQDNQTSYIVMEYIDGETLSSIVKKRGLFDWNDVMTKLLPIFSALEKMHHMNVFHLDVSPDNIMLRKMGNGEYGEPVLLDFGSAVSMVSDGKTQTKTAMAIRDGFSPPEQYHIDITSIKNHHEIELMDEYSCAATLYYVLTGKEPASSVIRSTTGQKNPFVSRINQSIPEYVSSAIDKGMSLNPSDRYQSLELLTNALRHPPIVQFKRIGIAAGILAICAMVAVFFVFNGKDRTMMLDADRSLNWIKGDQVKTGELIGKKDNLTIRYELKEMEPIDMSSLEDYQWEIHELKKNGKTEVVRLEFPKGE